MFLFEGDFNGKNNERSKYFPVNNSQIEISTESSLIIIFWIINLQKIITIWINTKAW